MAHDKKEEELSGKPEVTPWKHGEDTVKQRWKSLSTILQRPSSKFAPLTFNYEEDNLSIIQSDFRVLVVGAGGLGCEILKNLALSGFKDIEVLDLDTIELSNLNRQFLFRKEDIGKAKAECAAKFVMSRVSDCEIKWHCKPLQDFEESFYRKFNVVIAGLDNVEARRWLNAMLHDLVKKDEETGEIDPDTIIPFIDGGTEGFLGQCRLFIPALSSCFECSVGTMAPPKVFQTCTIATIPRRPEHCIAYAHKILWPKLKSLKSVEDFDMISEDEKNVADPHGVELDTDNNEHMSWIYKKALERAEKFKIEGVTYNLSMQVVKNIIPAIASTNALISAACVNEALKCLTWCSYGLQNYFMYMGQDGIYARTFNYQKNPNCPVCGVEPMVYRLDDEKNTLQSIIDKIKLDPVLKLQNPSISVGSKTIYLSGKALSKLYEENLNKKLNELMNDQDMLYVTDKRVLGQKAARITIEFVKGEIFVKPKDD